MSEIIEFTDSSGNVFADLGLPNPEERLLKANLAFQIKQLLDADGLTPEAAASRLRITLTQLEDLRLGRLAAISINELLEYAKRLGRHVQIQLAA
jgi:predicted XRE-type DNA-binding protein